VVFVFVPGRNGDTIRSLTRLSKAKIKVDTPDRRRDDQLVVISLSGTSAAIDSAKVSLFHLSLSLPRYHCFTCLLHSYSATGEIVYVFSVSFLLKVTS